MPLNPIFAEALEPFIHQPWQPPTPHAVFAAKVHQLAAFIEAHPELPVPSMVWAYCSSGSSVDAATLVTAADDRAVTLKERDTAQIAIAPGVTWDCCIDKTTLVADSETTTVITYRLPGGVQ